MSNLKNKVQLIGFLGNDPQVRILGENKTVAQFNIATSETYKNSTGEKTTDTQWHRIVAWGKIAQIVEKYVKKGSEVAVAGKLVNRSYEDKDGKKVYTTEVVVDELQMLARPKAKKEALAGVEILAAPKTKKSKI